MTINTDFDNLLIHKDYFLYLLACKVVVRSVLIKKYLKYNIFHTLTVGQHVSSWSVIDVNFASHFFSEGI
jgi:hypothetical protein